MNLAIIGATGLVGEEMLKVLDQRKIQFTNLTLVSSKKSVGKSLNFQEKSYQLISIEDALEKELDVAIFSAGKEVSLKWAPIFTKKGVTVIDNSSAWRMDTTKKLIVPEINGDECYRLWRGCECFGRPFLESWCAFGVRRVTANVTPLFGL